MVFIVGFADSWRDAISEDVRSLSLPGTYHEKIAVLGVALRSFTRLKHLDLSRNAIDSLQVRGWGKGLRIGVFCVMSEGLCKM